MNTKITEAEAIEIRLALEDRINNINKRIAECQSVNLTGNVNQFCSWLVNNK